MSPAFDPISAELDRIGAIIVDACYHIHRRLGPGLLESTYRKILLYELQKRGLKVAWEVPVPVQYDDLLIECGYKIDLLVEDSIILELKATTEDHPVFQAQLLTYMKLTNKRLGYLINFNKKLIKDGIHRLAL